MRPQTISIFIYLFFVKEESAGNPSFLSGSLRPIYTLFSLSASISSSFNLPPIIFLSLSVLFFQTSNRSLFIFAHSHELLFVHSFVIIHFYSLFRNFYLLLSAHTFLIPLIDFFILSSLDPPFLFLNKSRRICVSFLLFIFTYILIHFTLYLTCFLYLFPFISMIFLHLLFCICTHLLPFLYFIFQPSLMHFPKPYFIFNYFSLFSD